MRKRAWLERRVYQGSQPQTHGDGDEIWGQTEGSLEYLAKKPGLYDLGISESLTMSEESKNVLNYTKRHKLGGKIKGSLGSQNTHSEVSFNHLLDVNVDLSGMRFRFRWVIK